MAIFISQRQISIYNLKVMDGSSSLKDFTVVERLGEGSFACVYKVQRNDDKKFYAMKKVKISQMKEQERNNALNEVRILASLTHPNIVNYKEAFFDESTQSLCIVMELATAGDIQKKINQHIKNHSFFTEGEIWQAFIQMAKGLRALHEVNIFHRDLKCANVFCTTDNIYKLGDLNVSKVAKQGFARTQTGTPYYTSPEVWMNKSYNSKCDIWSLGCVVYEMASLHPPFKASNIKELCSKIQRGIYQRIPIHYSDELFSIINACLKVNPNSRPSAKQILENPKVMKNMSISEKYAFENQQSKKCNLISTILCPRNLKGLKNALPAAKYENSEEKQKVEEKKFGRVNSARSLGRPESKQIISTPKVNEAKEIKYAFMKRPPSRDLFPMKKQESVEVRQRQISKNYIKNSKLIRNNSVDSMRRRAASQGSNRSVEIQKKTLQKSKEKPDKGKAFMEDISSRCKQIEERVRLLVDKKKNDRLRVQKVSDSYEKKYNLMPKIITHQRNESSSHNRRNSRNNSIQLRPNNNILNGRNRSQSNNGNEKYKYMERNKSREINNSLDRNDSRKKNRYAYMPIKK